MSNEQTNVFNANCNCSTLNTDKLERLQKEMADPLIRMGLIFRSTFPPPPHPFPKQVWVKLNPFYSRLVE
jgi:hypothetical protein